MPLDTLICGSCQETFTDLNSFVFHKKNCTLNPRDEILQLHMNESGEITGMTSEHLGVKDERFSPVPQLAYLTNVNIEPDQDTGMIDGTTHLIILNRSIPEHGIKTSTIEVAEPIIQTVENNANMEILSPIKKKKVGRSKTGEGKTKVIEAVPPTIPRPTVPETNADGKLGCPQCKRTFTKERFFNTHKCLASSSYVDISKKEIVKIDSDEEEGVPELDAGAQDDESEEFSALLHEDKETDDEGNEEEKGGKNEDWTWKNKKGKKRKRSSYKFEIDLHIENSGAKQMKVAAEALENLPIFRNEEEKTSFEACIDVNLSHVDNMFRIHIIEQEVNELTGPTVSSLSVYICNVCDKVFKSLSHIRLHCVTHTDLKPFKCNKCKYTTNSKGNLYTHMRKHTGQFYRCEQCEFKTVNKSHLVEHQMTHDSRRSRCMICEKDYSTLKSLINHIRKYHTDKRGKEYLQTFLQGRGSKGATVIHQCHVCQRKFKKRLDRDRHLLVHDIKDLPHIQQCEFCDYWASRRIYLDKHYQKHRVIYCCALCNQKFLSTTRLTEHLTSSHANESGNFDLLDECISRSLYLPEPPAGQIKYVNLPDELLDPQMVNEKQMVSNKSPGDDISLSRSSPLGEGHSTDEQSNDFVADYINVSSVDGVLGDQPIKDQTEGSVNISNSLECSETGNKALKCQVDEDSKVLEERSLDDTETEGVNKMDESKENKIECLIKRLGYKNMTMEIFNKMRETFGTEECEYCGRLFYSKVDYEPHLRTHTGDKPFACSSCSFRATTKDQLRKHSEKEHEKVVFHCNKCDFIAPTRTRLWNHQLKHLGISGLSCPLCPQKFEGMKQLRAHIMNTHKEMDKEAIEKLTGYRHKPFGKMGRRSFKCPHCPRVFIRANSELQKHIWIHEGIKPFACPICPYACRSKNNLQAHMLRHSSEKPFSCSECGKDYKSKTALRWHVRSHKSGKLFKCDKCSYEATQSSHLKRHMETHDVLKRFICKHCEYSANTLGYMKIHYAKNHKGKEFVHDELADPAAMTSEKKVYKCLSCGYLFGNLSDLKRHFKIRHHIQMQDIAGMEQMQISEVEIVQYEEDSQNSKQQVQAPSSQGELQLEIPNEDGTMSAAHLLHQLLGMSQGVGETKLRVVNENGEPLDICVQQDGQLLFATGQGDLTQSSQYVIQYYNPDDASSSNVGESSSVHLLQAGSHLGSDYKGQLVITEGEELPSGEILHISDSTQESDSNQLVTNDREEGHIDLALHQENCQTLINL